MRHDILSDIFSSIKNSEAIGKSECFVPASNMVKSILRVMQKHNYIGNFEFIDDGKSGKFRIELLGRINNCGSVRPRFHIKNSDIIKYEKNFLPSVGVGILLISTSKGIMDHREVRAEGIGGSIIGYVY